MLWKDICHRYTPLLPYILAWCLFPGLGLDRPQMWGVMYCKQSEKESENNFILVAGRLSVIAFWTCCMHRLLFVLDVWLASAAGCYITEGYIVKSFNCGLNSSTQLKSLLLHTKCWSALAASNPLMHLTLGKVEICCRRHANCETPQLPGCITCGHHNIHGIVFKTIFSWRFLFRYKWCFWQDTRWQSFFPRLDWLENIEANHVLKRLVPFPGPLIPHQCYPAHWEWLKVSIILSNSTQASMRLSIKLYVLVCAYSSCYNGKHGVACPVWKKIAATTQTIGPFANISNDLSL